MKTRITLLALGVLLAVGGAAVSWWAATTRRETEAATADVRREARAMEARAQALEKENAVSRVPPAGDRFNSPPAAVQAALRAAAARLTAQSDPLDPVRQANAARRFREALPLSYYALYRAAGWSPAQIAKFENITALHEARDSDVRVASVENNLGLSDPAIAQLRREEETRFKAELREQLGEEGLRQFEDHRARAGERRVIGPLVGALALGPTPLSGPQAQQLTALVRTHGALPARGENAPWNPAAWEAVATQAAAFLAPAQLEELRAQVQLMRQESQTAELTRMLDAEQKAKPRAKVPGGG